MHKKEYLDLLKDLLLTHEEWLMEQILDYACKTGFSAYTSTLKEAWRLSISGLTNSIIAATERFTTTPELKPEYNFEEDPISRFGIEEAQRHRDRGVSLAMFLSLFKYYRLTYKDLIKDLGQEELDKEAALAYIDRVFDIIEIAFTVEWSGGKEETNIHQLQLMNMQITNEKNKYLTIFESLPSPAILVNSDGVIENMNMIAESFFNAESGSGGYYYKHSTPPGDVVDNAPPGLNTTQQSIKQILPWLSDELQLFMAGELMPSRFSKKVTLYKKEYTFVVRFSEMYDVSQKFKGVIIILQDVTKLQQAEQEIEQLAGFIPICSHCKKIRDDTGYWNKLEQFIEKRSDALFSHSICDSCLEKHYHIDGNE